MLYIRGSRCIIEYHYRLRRQKISIMRYQQNDSDIIVIQALYHCVFPVKNIRNRHAAPLPGKVSRMNRLTLTVLSMFVRKLNVSATDSDRWRRGHRLVIATVAHSLNVSDTRLIVPNIANRIGVPGVLCMP